MINNKFLTFLYIISPSILIDYKGFVPPTGVEPVVYPRQKLGGHTMAIQDK